MSTGLSHRVAIFACLFLGLSAALTGCTTYNDVEAFIPEDPRPRFSTTAYVIEPPDSIRIIAPSVPELHNTSHRLRPDGMITLQLVDEVLAAGKRPRDLARELMGEDMIGKYYEGAKIQIEVTNFASKTYYVAGETSGSRPWPYTGNTTVLDAALNAGIPFTAWPEWAVLIRPSEDPELVRRMTVDLKDMWEKGDLSRNAVLEEGDILFVPINPLAAVGRVIQNLLMPVDPLIRAVSTPARASASVSTGGAITP